MGILGRNGVGKSTLMLTLMGLVRPRAGSIRFDGRSWPGGARTRSPGRG